MKIPRAFYAELRRNIDILKVVGAHVSLKKRSNEYVGLCPFHNEKTPSFKVSLSRNSYYCFGCGSHGDVISFVAKFRGLTYQEATMLLAGDYGIRIPDMTPDENTKYDEMERISKVLAIANEFFKSQLKNSSNNAVIDYLKGRGLNREIIDKFEIGYSGKSDLISYLEKAKVPLMDMIRAGLVQKSLSNSIYDIFRGRIIFPIKNKYNKVVGFGGRSIDDKMPKYLNSPETILFKKNRSFYGENLAYRAMYQKDHVILVEGYMDCIKLYQYGIENVLCTMGTALSVEQLKILWNHVSEIVLCLDGDESGQKASMRVIDLALDQIGSERIISFASLPQDTDPDSYIEQYGCDKFLSMLENRLTMSEMIWSKMISESKTRVHYTPEYQALLRKKLLEITSKINDSGLRYAYDRFFKDKVWNLSRADAYKPSRQQKMKELPLENPPLIAITETESVELGIFYVVSIHYEILMDKSIRDALLLFRATNADIKKIKDKIDLLLKSSDFSSEHCIEIQNDILASVKFDNISQLYKKINHRRRDIFLDVKQLLDIMFRYHTILMLKASLCSADVDPDLVDLYANKINAEYLKFNKQLREFI